MRVKAIKEGFDGRQIRKEGEIFNFEGAKGSWMVEVDGHGNPVKGEKAPAAERPVRLGTKVGGGSGKTRDELREVCRKLEIKFPATAGAQVLADLIQKHQEAKEMGEGEKTSSDAPEGGDPGESGTGNQSVI